MFCLALYKSQGLSRYFKVLVSGQEGQVVKEVKLFGSLERSWFDIEGFDTGWNCGGFTILILLYLFQHHPLLLTCEDVPFSTSSLFVLLSIFPLYEIILFQRSNYLSYPWDDFVLYPGHSIGSL